MGNSAEQRKLAKQRDILASEMKSAAESDSIGIHRDMFEGCCEDAKFAAAYTKTQAYLNYLAVCAYLDIEPLTYSRLELEGIAS